MANKPMFIQYGKYTPPAPPSTNIYGVEWDGSSTTKWTRTDDAIDFTDPSPSYKSGSTYTSGSSPFDNISPWKDMIKSERTGGTMVAIPKFWYKWTKTGNAMKIQISSEEQDGFSVSPAHRNRGLGEKSVIYVGRYHCADSTYKSTSGAMPLASKTRAQFRTGIRNLGSNIYMYDYACLVTIWMLYLVEFADWNSQAKIGGGCSTSTAKMNMGYTDSMSYHTGTTATSINNTVYGGTQYRNIEGLWDNVYDFVDGISFNKTTIYGIKNPSQYADTTSSPAISIGTRTYSSSYISAYTFSTISDFDWFLYPSAFSGTSTTYICDTCFGSSTGVVFASGCDYNQGATGGLFTLYGNLATSGSHGSFGSRIVEYP